MKAVIYTRISTSGQTVEPQRMELAAFAASRSMPIVAEFSDVISGTKFTRDGLNALIAAAMRREFDTVLIIKIDRLGRSLANVLNLIETFDKLGIAVIATSQGIDTSKSNPAGRLTLGILSCCAEFERDLISERTRAGLAVARANGKILGKPSKVLVPDWREKVAAWQKETGGFGLRDLRKRLGGVCLATAAKCRDAIAA